MTDTVTCPECGATNPSDMAYCETCGASLEGVATQETPQDEPEQDSHQGEESFDELPADEALDAAEQPDADVEGEALDEDSHPVDGDDAVEAVEAVDEEDAAEYSDEDFDIEPLDASPEGVEDQAFDLESDAEQVDLADDDEFEIEAIDDDLEDEPVVTPDNESLSADEFEESFPEDDAFDEEISLEESSEDGDFDDANDDAVPIDEAPVIVPQRTTERRQITVDPLPQPGPHPFPPSLTIFHDQQALEVIDLMQDVTYIGSAADDSSPDEATDSADADVEDMDLEALAANAAHHTQDIETFAGPGGEEIDDDAAPLEEEPVADDSDDSEPSETADEEQSLADSGDGDEENTPAEEPVDELQTAVVDLSTLAGAELAKKHAAIFKQNKNYTLYVLADEPTQLNDELLELGERRSLSDGDVVILGETIALRFELDAA